MHKIVTLDRLFIAGALVVAAVLFSIGSVIVPAIREALDTRFYERPTSVSAEVERHVERYVGLIVDDAILRFDGDARCAEETVACVVLVTPNVVHVKASFIDTRWRDSDRDRVMATAIHGAAHVAEHTLELDVSPFAEIDPSVAPSEAFADCVAALVGVETGYVRCPIEYQEHALDLLGIDVVARLYVNVDDYTAAPEPSIAIWR